MKIRVSYVFLLAVLSFALLLVAGCSSTPQLIEVNRPVDRPNVFDASKRPFDKDIDDRCVSFSKVIRTVVILKGSGAPQSEIPALVTSDLPVQAIADEVYRNPFPPDVAQNKAFQTCQTATWPVLMSRLNQLASVLQERDRAERVPYKGHSLKLRLDNQDPK